jgi:hypothetical protein
MGERAETRVLATTTMLLPVKLTEHELAQVGRQIGEAQREADDIEAKAKAASDQFKDKLRGIEARVRELASVAYFGQEDRAVEVVEEHDYRTGVVRTIRSDTREVVSERAMFSHERQAKLALDDESTPRLHDGDEPEPAAPASGDVTDPVAVLGSDAEATGRVKRRGKRAGA